MLQLHLRVIRHYPLHPSAANMGRKNYLMPFNTAILLYLWLRGNDRGKFRGGEELEVRMYVIAII
jgi:hypothetical protein